MTSGELLKRLFRSFRQRDGEEFYSIAMQIIAEEEKKNHNILARDLRHILDNGFSKPADILHYSELERLPRDRERGTTLVEVRYSQKYLGDIILSSELEFQVDKILEEYRASSILRTYGLQPLRKLLFAGPPGCGKTLCAEVISGELGLPLLYTRFDSVISSYLGETAANLRKVFDLAEKGQWIVFFDEFDAIGKSREDVEDHGELKRVVNTFLQLLDNFRSDSLVIAATNHENLLDKALWRRFDDILFFDLPTENQIVELIELKLRSFHHKNVDFSEYIQQMSDWSHSDIEQVCLNAVKISVLGGNDELNKEAFSEAFNHQKKRRGIIQKTQK
jgi:SpoVK/Ycf46/Vps4 family AAA+-type ATPase